MYIININALYTEKAIPLCKSANFRLPTIRTAIEDWQLQSGFTWAYAIFTWNFQIIPSVGMRLRIRRPVQFQNTKPSLATTGEQQIFSCFNFISLNFYWCHILRGKADGMHLKNHLLRRRRFSGFSDRIWQKKTLYFHFSSEIIKLQTFALSMQWKSPETTLGLRIDSFLSNLRSSVLGGSVKVGGQGKG